MLTAYFKRQTTCATYYAGPAGPYLDEFTDWLAQRGYRQETIHDRIQGVSQLCTWLQTNGIRLQSLSIGVMNDFRHYLSDRNRLHIPCGQLSITWLGAQIFFEFLQAKRLVASSEIQPTDARPKLLGAFEDWMLVHRGVRPSTLANYRHHLIDLLTHLGEVPEQFNAGQLRAFTLTYAERSSLATAKTRTKATRAFLRFLIASGRCPIGLEAAVPKLAEWRLSTLPRYLPPADVERVIAACDGSTAIDIRDKAIILLLARLGLRASEVADLQFDAIDWSKATFIVTGKSRREAKLPLPQDVGDALLHYLETARPTVDDNHVFITAIAPWVPITRSVVKSAAAQAMRRAGVEAPSFGAHILRHSAATALLRQGASLQVIGEVLRHRCVDTTAHYAKIDVNLLQQVARPWPGSAPC